MSETGAVKFQHEQIKEPLAPFAEFSRLNAVRKTLWERRLIGVDKEGIGYGNLSLRQGLTRQFHITGTGTGSKAELDLGDYALVVQYDLVANRLRSKGLVVASAESLTHAAIYESDPAVRAVIHVHDYDLWSELKGMLPTTEAAIGYGTPEMAQEVKRLFSTTKVSSQKIFVMAGHESGVMAFGKDPEEACAILTDWLKDRGSTRLEEHTNDTPAIQPAAQS